MVATGRFARTLAALTIATGLAASIFAGSTPVLAATDATMVGGPAQPTVLPNASASVSVLLTNETTAALPAGTLTVAPSTTALLDEKSLNLWLSGKGRDNPVIAQAAVPEIASRGSVSISLSIPAAKLPQPNVWGVRGLVASYSRSGAETQTLRTSIVLLAAAAPAAVALSSVLPLVGPASALGLMTADELASSTAPGGYLTRMLNEAATAPVTLAVDPRITTSILTLGAAAPASASAWLTKLNSLKKSGFWLTYADGDIAGQIQAGAPAPVQPRVDDLANIPSPPAGSTWNGVNWPGWTPTISGLGWPIANTLTDAVLPAMRTGGFTQALVSTGNIGSPAPANSSAQLGGMPVGVVSDSASACAQDLERADTVAARASASACLASHVAVAATSTSASASVIVALSRSTPKLSFGSFSNALATLAAIPFTRPTTLDAVLAGSSTPATLIAEPESADRLSSLTAALANQVKIVTFAPVASDPALVVNPGARRLAAISSSAWLSQPAWASGLAENTALTDEVLTSVAIVTSSTINMVSGQARIPVVVRNDLPSAVKVTVHAVPSNARIEVTNDIPLTVQANAQERAYIPVTARVGSGSVTLKVSLTDTTGAAIGGVTSLPVNVRADWETFGLLGLGVVFFALITAGTIRTLRRRSKKAVADE